MTDVPMMPVHGEPPPWHSGDPHPAPARGSVPLSTLWFGVVGGPAAWSVQTLVSTAIASHACFPNLTPVSSPAIGGLRGITFAVSVVALLLCVASVLVAWRTWWRTREEHQSKSGRAQEHSPETALAETGEGRTRFMALSGVLTSITFLIVTGINTASIVVVTPCGR